MAALVSYIDSLWHFYWEKIPRLKQSMDKCNHLESELSLMEPNWLGLNSDNGPFIFFSIVHYKLFKLECNIHWLTSTTKLRFRKSFLQPHNLKKLDSRAQFWPPACARPSTSWPWRWSWSSSAERPAIVKKQPGQKVSPRDEGFLLNNETTFHAF